MNFHSRFYHRERIQKMANGPYVSTGAPMTIFNCYDSKFRAALIIQANAGHSRDFRNCKNAENRMHFSPPLLFTFCLFPSHSLCFRFKKQTRMEIERNGKRATVLTAIRHNTILSKYCSSAVARSSRTTFYSWLNFNETRNDVNLSIVYASNRSPCAELFRLEV